MEMVTLELPEQLAEEIKAHKAELPLILELGLERLASIASWRTADKRAYTPEEIKAADREFVRLFRGAISLGHPTGTDNEQIDADLAREYAGGLE